jgi:hypothetical protein
MATSLYAEQEADFCFKGDTVTVDGTLAVTGTSVFTGAVTLTGGQAALKLSSAPTGTTAGAVWTTGAPVLTNGQKYILCTAGATTWRIPVFDNA